MEKFNLLLVIKDYSQWINRGPYYLQKELSKNTNLFVWNRDGDMHDILNSIKFKPDFILIYLFSYGGPKVTGLATLKIPYGIYLEDLHHYPGRTNDEMKRENVKNIFTCCKDVFPDFYPEFSEKIKWLPHHVNTDIFKDYGKEKDIDMLLMGATNSYYYPLRAKILHTFINKKSFVYHAHPGYKNIKQEDLNKVIVDERYAQEINRAKIFFTCNSIYGYTVKKYFEVLACNTLLLAPCSNEILDLGLKPGIHFVDINENNFVEKAEYYLQNQKEREEISKNGFNLVQRMHSTSKRAQELTEMIQEIING